MSVREGCEVSVREGCEGLQPAFLDTLVLKG